MVANPLEEPLDDAKRDKEGDGKADGEDHPAMGVHMDRGKVGVEAGGPARFAPVQEVKAGPEAPDQVVEGGGDHGGDGDKEAEFKGGGSGHTRDLAGRNGGHGTRGAGEDSGGDLANADPYGLEGTSAQHRPRRRRGGRSTHRRPT